MEAQQKLIHFLVIHRFILELEPFVLFLDESCPTVAFRGFVILHKTLMEGILSKVGFEDGIDEGITVGD